jgi:hypothetical protein
MSPLVKKKNEKSIPSQKIPITESVMLCIYIYIYINTKMIITKLVTTHFTSLILFIKNQKN